MSEPHHMVIIDDIESMLGMKSSRASRKRLTIMERLMILQENVAQALEERGSTSLSFAALRRANEARCEDAYHPVEAWSLTDWMTAVTGEVGELAHEIKNLRRKEVEGHSQHNIPSPSKKQIGHEAADIVIYLDLLCARAGVDLGEAVRTKFNIVSDRVGSDRKL